MKFPYYQFNKNERDRIDAVRGFLCIYIFCFHFLQTWIRPGTHNFFEKLFSDLMVDGWIAVKIFFALSGFLICHSFARIQEQNQNRPLLEYFCRRIFRIFPAWFVTLAVYSVVKEKYEVRVFFENLFFFFGLKPFSFWNLTVMQSWSLLVEEIFYLSFPVFVWSYSKRILPQALVIYLLIHFLLSHMVPESEGVLFFTPFNGMSYFAYGIVAYFSLPFLRNLKLSEKHFIFLFLAISCMTFFIKSRFSLIEIYIVFCLLFIVRCPARVAQPMNFLFRDFGKYCFSIYLVHLLCVERAGQIYEWLLRDTPVDLGAWRVALLFGMSLFMTLGFAFLLYQLIERPFINWGARIFNRSQACSAEVVKLLEKKSV